MKIKLWLSLVAIELLTGGCYFGCWESGEYDYVGRENISKKLDRYRYPVNEISGISFFVGLGSSGCYMGLHGPYKLSITAYHRAINDPAMKLDSVKVRRLGDEAIIFEAKDYVMHFEDHPRDINLSQVEGCRHSRARWTLPDVLTPKDGKSLIVEIEVTITTKDPVSGAAQTIPAKLHFVMLPKYEWGIIKPLVI